MPEANAPRTYKFIELVGVAPDSYEDAISNAVKQASQTLEGLAWYEVTEFRGRIVNGKVTEFQATIKVAFQVR